MSVILSGLPADFPAALVIVMHLSPDHKSILAEILDRRTHLLVKQARTGDVDFILPLDKIAAKLVQLVVGGKKATNARTSGKRKPTTRAGNSLRSSYAASAKAAMIMCEQ